MNKVIAVHSTFSLKGTCNRKGREKKRKERKRKRRSVSVCGWMQKQEEKRREKTIPFFRVFELQGE
jgi:hypothetical protein